MLGNRLSEQEMRKESRRLIKNLSRRVDRIENYKNMASQYVVNQYRKLENKIPKKLTDLNKKDLQTLYRDLKYLNSLKGSTVKGAKQSEQTWQPIKDKLNQLSEPVRNRFWEVYGKLYEHSSTMEHFKYELFKTDIDLMFEGQNVDDIVNDIINEYDKAQKELGSMATDEDLKLLFTSKLKELRK